MQDGAQWLLPRSALSSPGEKVKIRDVHGNLLQVPASLFVDVILPKIDVQLGLSVSSAEQVLFLDAAGKLVAIPESSLTGKISRLFQLTLVAVPTSPKSGILSSYADPKKPAFDNKSRSRKSEIPDQIFIDNEGNFVSIPLRLFPEVLTTEETYVSLRSITGKVHVLPTSLMQATNPNTFVKDIDGKSLVVPKPFTAADYASSDDAKKDLHEFEINNLGNKLALPMSVCEG